MQPRMSAAERRLFESFLRASDQYFEFGAGGSTCLAAQIVKTSVTALDSSREWLDNVEKYCAENPAPVIPSLIHVDIGPTGEWGYPSDPSTIANWPGYHSTIWQSPGYEDLDFYMVDGRFRVACFIQVLLHCRPDAVIAFHDFASRPAYHVVRQVAQEIAVDEDLSVFVKKPGDYRAVAEEILKAHWLATW